MLKKSVLKALLGVSAVAALFGALAAQAQTPQDTAPQGTTGQQGTSGTSPSATGAATDAAAATLSKADQKIVTDMARANMAEIEMGKLAQSKSQSEQVKNYAQQMIDDHTQALTELQQMAQAKGATMPTELDAKHKAMASKMDGMSGEGFDKMYMSQAGVSDHKSVIRMLKQQHSRAKDPELKALAAKMMPTVEQHLNAALQMQGAKGTSPGTGAAGDTMPAGKTQ